MLCFTVTQKCLCTYHLLKNYDAVAVTGQSFGKKKRNRCTFFAINDGKKVVDI